MDLGVSLFSNFSMVINYLRDKICFHRSKDAALLLPLPLPSLSWAEAPDPHQTVRASLGPSLRARLSCLRVVMD